MDDLFFVASKVAGLMVKTESWVVLGLLAALLAQARGRSGAGFVLGTLVLVAGLAAYPVGDVLLGRLERVYPANPPLQRVDTIIVLGGAEETGPYRQWGGWQMNDAAERVIAGAVLAARFPEAKLVFSGGVGVLVAGKGGQAPSQMTRDLWLDLGIASERIVLESGSRSTSENARLTYDLLQPAAGQSTVLVTSAFHMPRAMETFARAGWPSLVAYPVDFRSGDLAWRPVWKLGDNLAELNTALKEYLGLAGYRLLGR